MGHRLVVPPLLALACAQPVELRGGPSGSDCLELEARWQGDEELVYDLAFHPSDDELLVTGSTSALRAYRIEGPDAEGTATLAHVATDTAPERFNSIAFAPTGRLYAPTGRELRWYDLSSDPADPDPGGALDLQPTGTLQLVDTPQVELQRAHVTADGAHLVACDTAGDLHLVDLTGPAPAVADRIRAHRRCTRVHTSPDSRWVLSAGHDGHVVLTELTAEGLRQADDLDMGGESGEARFGPSTEVAWAGAFDAPYALWELSVDPAQGRLALRAEHHDHQSGIGAIDTDPTGTLLFTGDHDHTVHVYDVGADGELSVRSVLPSDGHGVHSARASPSGQWLARTAANVDELLLYDLEGCVR